MPQVYYFTVTGLCAVFPVTDVDKEVLNVTTAGVGCTHVPGLNDKGRHQLVCNWKQTFYSVILFYCGGGGER